MAKKLKFLKTFVDIKKQKNGQYRFTAVAANGEIISVSESYTRKSSVVRGARRAFPKAILRDLAA